MHGQVEAGSLCPVTMTSAAIPVLQKEDWFATLSSRLYSLQYAEHDAPLSRSTSMMLGLCMTAHQVGSAFLCFSSRSHPFVFPWLSLPSLFPPFFFFFFFLFFFFFFLF